MLAGTDGPEAEIIAAEPVSAFQLITRNDPHGGDDARDEQRYTQATRQVSHGDLLRFGKFARQVMDERQLSGRSKMTSNDRYVSETSHRHRLMIISVQMHIFQNPNNLRTITICSALPVFWGCLTATRSIRWREPSLQSRPIRVAIRSGAVEREGWGRALTGPVVYISGVRPTSEFLTDLRQRGTGSQSPKCNRRPTRDDSSSESA